MLQLKCIVRGEGGGWCIPSHDHGVDVHNEAREASSEVVQEPVGHVAQQLLEVGSQLLVVVLLVVSNVGMDRPCCGAHEGDPRHWQSCTCRQPKRAWGRVKEIIGL